MAGLLDFFQSASNSVASNVSAPVDGIAWALRKLGAPMPANPVGGSDWMEQKGFTRPVQQSGASLAGEFAGMAGPMLAAAKAPQIARGLLQGADNLAAPQTLSKQAGVFIGPGAKTWNADAAKRAQAMADAGTDARKVWSETGTWKGPDGAWRQEIPDNAAGMRLGGPKFGTQEYTKLSETLAHKDLMRAYPDMGDIKVTWDAASTPSYANSGPFEYLNLNLPGSGNKNTSSALHEVQHAVQQREGFAKGGRPGANGLSWDELGGEARKIYEQSQATHGDPLLAALFGDAPPLKEWGKLGKQGQMPWFEQAQTSTYRRLAGEAEARATESRIPLDAAQRRALFPADSYDVPLNQLIIRK